MGDGPYRSSDVTDQAPSAPMGGGIVDDVIAQFADPFAFYRELVQNAIDAGSPTVEVRIERVEDAGITRVAVKDRGEGMSKDIIENQLLVLFRSTKERDRGKIGKFGIGFASVLSPDPQVVVVNSARDGRRLTLHLSRDLTYRLFDAGPATQTGTSVELDIPMPADQLEDFVDKSGTALARWCGHASIPIEFHAMQRQRRIDAPLGLPGAVFAVTATDGELTVVVGAMPDLQPRTTLFNHGLMLFDTSRPWFGPLAVKIQDSRLGHTLSRDDVRRDKAFDRAMAFTRDVIENRLPAAATAAIAAACDSDLKLHATLVDAVIAAKIAATVVMPTLGGPPVKLKDLGRTVWGTVESSPLALEVAIESTVLRAVSIGWLAPTVEAFGKCRVRWIEHELTRIEPVAFTEGNDLVIADAVREAFEASGTAPSKIVYAKLSGSLGLNLCLVGRDREDPHHVDREQASQSPFGLFRKGPLVISIDHAYVRAARAASDPRIAATMLVRAILLGYRKLDVDASERILELALGKIGLA